MACNFSPQGESKINTSQTASDSLPVAMDSIPVRHPEIKDSIPGIRQVYVISRSGTKAWTKNKDEAECFYFGRPLTVVSENDTSLGVKLYYDSRFIWIVYVNKTETGTELELPLDNFDLNSNDCEYYIGYNNNDKFSCEEQERGNFNPDDYPDLEINLISKEKFEIMKKRSIKYFTPDSSIKKVDGKITLKLEKGVKIFKDEGEDNYTYLGQINFLNAYVIYYSCGQCEESFCLLIDKRTGEMVAEKNEGFPSLPDFSANKKYIMILKPDFDDATDVSVYKYAKDSIISFVYKKFGSWLPMKEGFWGSDDCYYVAVIPSILRYDYDIYAHADSKMRMEKEYNFRYIRIKIKGPTKFEER